jgi:hypothetical protein
MSDQERRIVKNLTTEFLGFVAVALPITFGVLFLIASITVKMEGF